MRAVLAPILCAPLLLVAGCTALVAVDPYTFDVDPCGPRPTICPSTGRTYTFVLRSVDVPIAGPANRRDGFDFDGTNDPICDQQDFVSPDGTTGIDNSMATIFELYESLTGDDLHARASADAIAGHTRLIVFENVDDPIEDDCVVITQRDVVLPVGVTTADLDRDGDGLLDAGLTFDYLSPASRDPVACLRDGVLHGRFPPSYGLLPGTTAEGAIDRGRFEMPFDESASHPALVGGSFRVEELRGSLPDAVVEFIDLHADLDPSSRSARDCGSISFGMYAELVPANLGVLRMPTP